LANTIERAVIVSRAAQIDEVDMPEAMRVSVATQARGNRRPTLAEVEEQHIRETLTAAGGNKTEAARMLGISRKNLYERLARMRTEIRDQRSEVGDQRSDVGKEPTELEVKGLASDEVDGGHASH
jgi:DNA-binding NtrC family response regulator